MAIMEFTKTALKNLFSKPAPRNYPVEKRIYPEGSRGHVEINIDDCIMCGACQRKCPSGAITVDRANHTWSIERMGCVQCSNCVNGCPKNCLEMAKGYTEPNTSKVVDTYQKKVEEAQKSAGTKVMNDMSKCILCGLCARKCPEGCITVDRTGEKTWSIDRDKCVGCGACVDACIKFKSLSMVENDNEKGTSVFKKEQ